MTGYFNYETNEWTPPEGGWKYTNLHARTWECDRYGCMVHNPDLEWVGNRENWPYSPRGDGRMERICPHGIGHPDPDTAEYLERTFYGTWMWVHGCHLNDKGGPCCA